MPSLQDRIEISGGIAEYTTRSQLKCADHCLDHADCWSLFYNSATKICRINKDHFFALNDTTSTPGFRFYTRESCTRTIPAISHTTHTWSISNGIVTVTFACEVNAIYITGSKVMTCDEGKVKWGTPDLVCQDLSPYNALGYTEVCGTESILKFVGSQVQFEVAKSDCEADGGHLSRPITTVRWICVKDYALSRSSGVHVWTDITDRVEEGVLRFTDNSLVPLPHYWQPGEPLASTKDWVDCVCVWPNSKLWDDIPCDNLAHYICEIEL
ncbi:uncharacterized protein [Argopecten irradians]|uniref:uncharacterized protein n=1 Tax=Argopecten irradians TaxID=31199 RepID=UPI003719E698